MDQLVVIELTLYSRPGCHLCTDMRLTIERTLRQLDALARVEEINIAEDPELEKRYGLEVPVLLVNGKKAAKYRVTEEKLIRLLGGMA